MASLLSGTGITISPGESNANPPLTIHVGGLTIEQGVLLSSTSSTPFRTQIRLDMSGDLHICDAGIGVGTYNFSILLGPYTSCKGVSYDTITPSYLSGTKNRGVSIQLNPNTNGRPASTFTGVIVSMDTETVGNNGVMGIYLKIQAKGLWS